METRAAKVPYVDYKLYTRVKKHLETGKKPPMIKTYSRRSTIIGIFIGFTFHVHNGKGFVPVFVSENHVGHKLGEFAPTRKFSGHPVAKKDVKPAKKGGK